MRSKSSRQIPANFAIYTDSAAFSEPYCIGNFSDKSVMHVGETHFCRCLSVLSSEKGLGQPSNRTAEESVFDSRQKQTVHLHSLQTYSGNHPAPYPMDTSSQGFIGWGLNLSTLHLMHKLKIRANIQILQ